MLDFYQLWKEAHEEIGALKYKLTVAERQTAEKCAQIAEHSDFGWTAASRIRRDIMGVKEG